MQKTESLKGQISDSRFRVYALMHERLTILKKEKELDSISDKEQRITKKEDLYLKQERPWSYGYVFFVTDELKVVLEKMIQKCSSDKGMKSVLEHNVSSLDTRVSNYREKPHDQLQSRSYYLFRDGGKAFGNILSHTVDLATRQPELQSCFKDFPADIILLIEKGENPEHAEGDYRLDIHRTLLGCAGWEFDQNMKPGEGLYKILEWQKPTEVPLQ